MFAYFAVIFLGIIGDYLKLVGNWRLIILLIVMLFLCFGYMTGSDWRQYEIMYDYVSTDSSFMFFTEPGYYLYMYIGKLLSLDFWTFFITTKCILCYLILRCIYRLLPESFFFSLSVFLCFFAFAWFIDNPMRNLIACTIYLYGYKYIEEQKCIKYILVCIIASSFHFTAIVLLPVYWLANTKIRSSVLVIAYILLNIILFIFPEKINAIFSNIGGEIGQRLLSYFSGDKNEYITSCGFSLGLLFRYFIFYLLITYRKQVEKKFGSPFFYLIVLSIFIHRIGVNIPIFTRFVYYYAIPFVVYVSYSCTHFSLKSRRCYYIFIFIMILFMTKSLITSDYRYIPYSNYLEYIMNVDKPSYEERFNYNYENSPYNKDE